jgi:hypothetical protein
MDSSSGFREPGLHAERPITTYNGFVVLLIGLLILGGSVWQLINVVSTRPTLMGVLAAIGLFVLGVLVLAGLYTLQPNEAAILQLFGAYRGTSRVPGLRATNPFYTRKKLSLRARNLMGDKLKVNDKRGNPIEIACVVVWHIEDTAKAAFDVDDYEMFVKVPERGRPSVTLRRRLPTTPGEGLPETVATPNEPTLLNAADVVTRALVKELQARLAQAGVVVEEARITHLAYAPEIAQVMLRRQQAEAIIAARSKIVHGAVSMVQMALSELSAKQVVDLDDERKASMVSNLMTVLCSESDVQPVINTGTLYRLTRRPHATHCLDRAGAGARHGCRDDRRHQSAAAGHGRGAFRPARRGQWLDDARRLHAVHGRVRRRHPAADRHHHIRRGTGSARHAEHPQPQVLEHAGTACARDREGDDVDGLAGDPCLAFIVGVHWLLIRANTGASAHLPNDAFYALLGIFAVAIVGWAVALFARFRRPG